MFDNPLNILFQTKRKCITCTEVNSYPSFPQADSFSGFLFGLLQTHIDLGMIQYCHTYMQ